MGPCWRAGEGAGGDVGKGNVIWAGTGPGRKGGPDDGRAGIRTGIGA